MSKDLEYLSNYKPDTLYTHPGKDGVYAKLVGDSEVLLGEMEISTRFRIAVSAFHVNEKGDYNTFKITKLKYHKTHGWNEDGEVHVNGFQLSQMKEFVSLLSSINLHGSQKAKISLGDINLDALGVLLNSSKGSDLIRELSSSPDLPNDIYAVATKRAALSQFEDNLTSDLTEPQWQVFFEQNPWIFGHGLNYIFLDKVGDRLEVATTGSDFSKSGKRADALMRTRAAVSQCVLVEIKKHNTDLLQKDHYRAGCWSPSKELSGAITQIQKTVFEFSNKRFREDLKDSLGNSLNDRVYSVEPRSYLVIGNLAELRDNDDKIACFELYRRNIRSPEILTFDELYYRAKCIVENVSKDASQ